MLGVEGRQCKDCVVPQLGTAQRLVVSGVSLSFGFLQRPAFAICYLHYMLESVGGAKQAAM